MSPTAERTRVLELLASYARRASREGDGDQGRTLVAFRSFVAGTPDCLERSHLAGHLTTSAWIVDPARTRALLMLHRKLGRWLQPGGHADGDADLLRVASREVREETGLDRFEPVSEEIFDLDIHSIPERGAVPSHLHYDVRFLFEADPLLAPVSNSESLAVAWVPFGEIAGLETDESVLRLLRKGAR